MYLNTHMQLQVLEYENDGFVKKLTTYEIGGELWFVTSEICKLLEIDDDEVQKLEEDEKQTTMVQTDEYFKNINLISESGLYYLLFCSRMDFALTFRRWVTKDVIPSIRKADFYTARRLRTPNFP